MQQDLTLDIAAEKEAVTIRCQVTNTGDRNGDEVVQLYVTDEIASMLRPARELAGFKRLHLAAGESKVVSFTCQYSQLAFLNKNMQWVSEAGRMGIQIGSSGRQI